MVTTAAHGAGGCGFAGCFFFNFFLLVGAPLAPCAPVSACPSLSGVEVTRGGSLSPGCGFSQAIFGDPALSAHGESEGHGGGQRCFTSGVTAKKIGTRPYPASEERAEMG